MSERKKRKRSSCPFLPKRSTKRKGISKSFDKDWAAQLAASDKGSYYNQEALEGGENRNEEEGPDQVAEIVSTSHSKILAANGSQDEGKPDSSDKLVSGNESWQVLRGRTIVSGETLVENLDQAVSCRVCHADVTVLENLNGKSGLGSTWRISCSNEECPTKATNAPFNTTDRGKGFEINRASVLSFRAIGRGHSAAAKAFSFLGLKPINDQYWTEHTKRIELEAKKALEKELDKAAFEVKEFKFTAGELDCSRDELPQTVVKAGVTIHASWSSRGWSATDAVVAAISVDTGKVVDVVHLSSSCTECKKIEHKRQDSQMTRLQYLSAVIAHEENCYLNHEGSSASMEAAGAKMLYRRSLSRGLQYIPYIGDGDSKAYSAVQQDQPYGPSVYIPKEECIAHVTKRMGSGLRKLLNEHKKKKLADGKALGGAGRLTHSRIDTMQGFYGKAIRDNKDDAKGMAKATHAILKHYSSTEEDPRHEDCPAGSNSWCSFQRDVANGTNLHQPIENPFPDAVVEVMQPLFNRLGDETFLVGCEKCYTQNQNESLHHVIWGMAAKEMYSSPQEISIAISLGVLHFNQGYEKTYCSLLPSLGVEVTPEMVEAWQRIDGARLYQASYKNLPSTKLRRKKKRNAKLKKIDAFRRTEGPDMYKSQAYHGGYKSGKQPRKGNKKGKKSAKKK